MTQEEIVQLNLTREEARHILHALKRTLARNQHGDLEGILDTPVSFPIAKLLKEKGFDIANTVGYYDSSKLIIDKNYLNRYPQGNIVELNWNNFSNKYSAPIVSEVIMWLYEKHGIWVSVDWMKRIKPYNSGFYCHLRGTNKSLNRDNFIVINDTLNPGYEVFNSPTEAYEAAIEYALLNVC